MLIASVSDISLWLGLDTIAIKSVVNKVRCAIVAKSIAKVWVLLTTAVSEADVWTVLATIADKSVANKVRLAIIAKSVANV